MLSSLIKIHSFHQVLMVVLMLMMLSNIKSLGSLNLICNVNLLAWKLISPRILYLLVPLILMRCFRGMCKLEIFCKLWEGIRHQFLLSKWLGRGLLQGRGIRHSRFMKFLLENSMLKLSNIAQKSQQSLSTQTKFNALQPQWRAKFTFGMSKEGAWSESSILRFKVEEVTLARFQQTMIRAQST